MAQPMTGRRLVGAETERQVIDFLLLEAEALPRLLIHLRLKQAIRLRPLRERGRRRAPSGGSCLLPCPAVRVTARCMTQQCARAWSAWWC